MAVSNAPVTIADEGARLRHLTRLLFAVGWVVPAMLAADTLGRAAS